MHTDTMPQLLLQRVAPRNDSALSVTFRVMVIVVGSKSDGGKKITRDCDTMRGLRYDYEVELLFVFCFWVRAMSNPFTVA